MIKMLDRKLNEISDNQVELAETLLNVSEKVKEMEHMIGWSMISFFWYFTLNLPTHI